MRLRLGSAGWGFAHILTGSVGAQLIALMALPVLSRQYTPAEFGYYSLVLSLASLATPTATLRFEAAAMLPSSTREVQALAWNTIFSTLALSLLFGALLQALAWTGIGDLAHHNSLPGWVTLTVALSATFTLLSQLSLRKQQYSFLARRSVFRSLAMTVTQIGLGMAKQAGEGLVIGSVIGNAVGITSTYARTREYLHFPGFAEIRQAWRKYWRFPAIFAPSSLLNSAGLQAPVIFFTFWFGIANGGQLGMAERIAGVPLALVGTAVGQVIDAEISRRIRDQSGGLRSTYLRLSRALAAIGAAVALGLAAGGWIIPWVLGDQWLLTGHIVQVLALNSGIRLLAGPLSRFLILLQRSLANTLLDLLRVMLIAASMIAIGVLHIAFMPALWLVYGGLSFTYTITWIYGLRLVTLADRQ